MDVFTTLVPIAALVTSALSAVFGMAGGMILMGVYAATLPIPTAMVLHSVSQLFANGFRAFRLRRHVLAGGLGWYGLGAVAALGTFALLSIVVARPVMFLLLGGVPLALSALPRRVAPRFDHPAGAVCCGALVAITNVAAGAAGALLDVFFVRARMDRFAVIATKATTQTAAHILRIVYFGALVPEASAVIDLPVWIYPVLVGCAFAGTHIGGRLLERLGEAHFRRWTGRIVLALSLIYVARGARELGWLPFPPFE